MTEAGWYGEPGNAALERYWDGAQWTPQTRASIDELRRQVTAPAPAPHVSGRRVNQHPAWANVVAGAVVLVVGGGIAWAVVAGNSKHHSSPPAGTSISIPNYGSSVPDLEPTIVYTLTGTATSADLTLTDAGGGTSQQSNATIPLTNQSGTPGIRFTATAGQQLYFSAQNDGDGTMTCTITDDGAVVDTETSSGQFTIVTCQGSA